jgi:hypothetical protein
MELLALGKPIKKPPRSDERDGELFCGMSSLGTFTGTATIDVTQYSKDPNDYVIELVSLPSQSAYGLGSTTAWTSTFYGNLYNPVVSKTISGNTLTVVVGVNFRTQNSAGQASTAVTYQPTYRVLY